MEEVNRIGGEAERNQLKRRTELIGKPSLVVYHRKNVLSFEEIKHFFVGCNLNSPPYKPNIPLIHVYYAINYGSSVKWIDISHKLGHFS